MRIGVIFLLYFLPVSLLGQSSVFVLVDISGSTPGNNGVREDAKKIVESICLADFDKEEFPRWKWYGNSSDANLKQIEEGKGSPLLDPNKDAYLMVMPFGEKDTYKDYNFKKLNDLTEFKDYYELFYPKVFKDKFTTIDIARAWAASIAKGKKLISYYLIEVSDQDVHTSTDVTYTDEERKLIAEYGSAQNPEVKLATIWFGANQYRIEIKKVKTPNITPKPTGDNEVPTLSLVKPQGGTKAKPVKHSGPIIWKCDGCTGEEEYIVTARYLGSKQGVATLSKKVTAKSYSFPFVESGLYQITVTAEGLSAPAAYADITVKNMVSNEDREGGVRLSRSFSFY